MEAFAADAFEGWRSAFEARVAGFAFEGAAFVASFFATGAFTGLAFDTAPFPFFEVAVVSARADGFVLAATGFFTVVGALPRAG